MSAAISDSKAIFFAALEQPLPAERARYVDAACGGDLQLRSRVEQLLAAHDQAGQFLGGAGATAVMNNLSLTERPGTKIGPYKLLQPIGEGGMGTVYLAEQTEPVERKVALKVIKAGMDTQQVIARFEAERQALAMMDHVNIARVLDVGATQSGRPFFVMELVQGVPITKYCDDNHLTPRERLELFVPVCRAIQHAHTKGIIHRDIKPSNVMVTLYDGQPVPKVIDFGVAKATEQKLTERTLFTQYGTMVGTLEYMSPEQAEMSALGVDTRSDIYSLGVLLYELLTGNTPLTHKRMKDAAYAEIMRMIKEDEPPKPSTRLSDSGEALASISVNRHMEPAKLTKLVRGELDWIVMKTLEKDRNRRYETANGFAADVQRYLADEPVLACPPSAWYRFRKFARRNKRTLATAALFGVMLLAAVGAVTGTVGWAVRDRESREQELARKTERDLALTEQGVHQAVEQAAKIHGELHAVLTKPGGVQELLNQPGRWNFSIQSAQSELAQARRSSASAEGSLSAELTQALHKLEVQLSGDEADRLLALRLEKIRLDWATWVEGSFDYRKAAAEYPQAFAGFAVLKEDAAAVAARLRSSPINEQLVAALDDWALVAFLLRNQRLAEQLLAVAQHAAPDPGWADRLRQLKGWRDQEALGKLVEEAPVTRLSPQMLALVGRLLPDQSSLQESWLRRAQAQNPADFWLNFNLGNALSKTQPLEATGFYRVALAVRPTSSAAYTNLGNVLRDQKKLPEAIAAFHKAIAIDPKHAIAYNQLGLALRDQKKLPEAVAAYLKAIEIDPNYAYAHTNLGNVLCDQKKLPEAVAALHQAIEIDPKLANAYGNLGNALSNQKKLPEAIAAYHKAIEIDPKHANAYTSLGNALLDQKKLPEAVAAYHKAIEIDPKLAFAYSGLGNALRDQKQLDEAIAAFHKSLEIDPKNAFAYSGLGNALRDQNKLDEAIAAYHNAIEIDPNYAMIYNSLGIALRDQNKLPEAIAAFHKAIEIDPKLAFAYNNLGIALRDQNKLPEAIVAYHKAIEIDPSYARAYNNLGIALRTQGKLDEAIAELRQAITLDKKLAAASPQPTQFQFSLANLLNDRAWQLVTGCDPKSREPGRAIQLAQEAAALVPNDAACRKTLGVAHYRAGNWKAAALALEQYLQLNPAYSKDSVILFFLSMAHGRLNEKEQARTFYDQAAQWRMGIGATEEELRRLCAEAAALLGLEVPPTLTEPPVLTPGPTLLKPAAGATLDNGTLDGSKLMVWEFDWSDVPGATQYHLYVAMAKAPVFNNPTLTSAAYRREAKGYVADQVRLGRRWKVRALVQGTWTDWSEERTFDVAPLSDDKPPSPKK